MKEFIFSPEVAFIVISVCVVGIMVEVIKWWKKRKGNESEADEGVVYRVDGKPLRRIEIPEDENFELVGDTIDAIDYLDWPEDAKSDEYREYFNNLKSEFRYIWATWLVQMWLEDWGFGQYFLNINHGDWVEQAEEGFKAIGADEIGTIFTKVADYYEENRERIEASKNQEEYDELMGIKAIETKFGDILGDFYNKKPEFYVQRADYIRKNRSAFEELGVFDESDG